MAEHLLDAPQIRSTFEQVRGEGMAEQVRVNASRLETGSVGELPEDEEGTSTRERPPASVQEELGTVAPIEMWAAESQVATRGLGGGPSERYEAFLPALPDDAHDAFLDVDAALLQADGLRDT